MIVEALVAFALQSAAIAAVEPGSARLPQMKQAHLIWKRAPDTFLMTKYFPRAAKSAGVAKAKVELACEADAYGALDCDTLSESVTGLGFGEAAAKVVEHGRVTNTDQGGSPEGRRFRYTVKFGAWAPDED